MSTGEIETGSKLLSNVPKGGGGLNITHVRHLLVSSLPVPSKESRRLGTQDLMTPILSIPVTTSGVIPLLHRSCLLLVSLLSCVRQCFLCTESHSSNVRKIPGVLRKLPQHSSLRVLDQS